MKLNHGLHAAKYWHATTDGRIQCDLCPRDCKLHNGQRGACFVRKRVDNEIVLTTYGRSSGFCIDPIEKKPLNHFYPGSSVLSFGTAGCNLACKFCQNWDISKSRSMDRLMDQASPDAIARAAAKYNCRSVAFTYNDPVIFFEYAKDVAEACHERGVKTVAVTAGYIHAEPRTEFFEHIDAANIDLKSFSDQFYYKLTGSRLQPVLDTLIYLRRETQVWIEITTLLIPGQNDSATEITALCRWVLNELGADVPVHFSAFHPDHKMNDLPPTPVETLYKARDIGLNTGLKYVYTGNVHHREGDTTRCPACNAAVIVRDWYELERYTLNQDGRCDRCNTEIAGCFDNQPGQFGRKRIPISLAVS